MTARVTGRRDLLRWSGAAALTPLLPRLALGQARAPLMLGAGAIERARDALGANPAGAAILASVMKRAGELLGKPPKEREYEPGRNVILPTSREILERVQTLGAAHFLAGGARFAARAVEEIVAACAQPDWNPAHFLDTAEMANAVGLGLGWFGGAMTAGQRRLVTETLLQRAAALAFNAYRGGDFWTKARHNWNLVCNGGMAVAAVALGEYAPEQSHRLLGLALDSVREGFSAYAPDGGCVEGASYWDYGTRYAVYLLAALESASIEDRGLAASPGFAATGRFFLHMTGPTGLMFNYADCGETVRRSPHRFWLARRFGRPAEASDELARGGAARGMHALWFPAPAVSPAEAGEKLDAVFRGVQVAMFRSAWGGRNAMYLACKGGDNAANHAHLDLGSFVLDWGGTRFAMDLGSDDYALPGYFEKRRRFDYLRMASAGHNVLLADRGNQDPGASAAISLFRSTPSFACAIAELDAANPALKHRRGFALIDRSWVVVADEIAPRRAADLKWQIYTRANVAAQGALATLDRDGAALRAHIVEPAGAAFAVESADAPPPQNPNKGVSRLAVKLGGRDEPLRVAVAFGPAADCPARVRDLARAPLERWGKAT